MTEERKDMNRSSKLFAVCLTLASAGATVLLPVASTEQHGPHLGTGVDSLLCGEVCRRAATMAIERRPVADHPTGPELKPLPPPPEKVVERPVTAVHVRVMPQSPMTPAAAVGASLPAGHGVTRAPEGFLGGAGRHRRKGREQGLQRNRISRDQPDRGPKTRSFPQTRHSNPTGGFHISDKNPGEARFPHLYCRT